MELNPQSTDVPANSYVGRWMTHDELAAMCGTDRSAAVRLALRHGWQRQRDKHRVLRVLVPVEWVNQKGFDRSVLGADAGNAVFVDAAEQATRATEAPRALAAEGDRRSTEVRADAERARADVLDQSLASERVRADALRKQVEVAEGTLAAERDDANALRKRMNELKELLAGVLRSQNLKS